MVRATLALPLALPGEAYPTCDLLTGFAFPVAQQFFGIDGRNIQMKINSVQQRPGQFPLVTFGFFTAITAAFVRVAEVPAGTGVHGGNELKAGGESELLGGTGNADFAGLQWLSHDLQHLSVKLG